MILGKGLARGLVDGVVCFHILYRNNRPLTFRFRVKIKLPKDDRLLLEYLATGFI